MNETSCGGTSNDTVRRSTFTMLSVHGKMQNKPVSIHTLQWFISLFGLVFRSIQTLRTLTGLRVNYLGYLCPQILLKPPLAIARAA